MAYLLENFIPTLTLSILRNFLFIFYIFIMHPEPNLPQILPSTLKGFLDA